MQLDRSLYKKSPNETHFPLLTRTAATNIFHALKTVDLDPFCDEDFKPLATFKSANDGIVNYKHKIVYKTHKTTPNSKMQSERELGHLNSPDTNHPSQRTIASGINRSRPKNYRNHGSRPNCLAPNKAAHNEHHRNSQTFRQ